MTAKVIFSCPAWISLPIDITNNQNKNKKETTFKLKRMRVLTRHGRALVLALLLTPLFSPAQELAQKGWTYNQILGHYYQGASLARLKAGGEG